MASETTLEKYRKKLGTMDADALRGEISRLEESFVRVSAELYSLATSPESLDPDKSYKARVQSRINNQTMWNARLDAAIQELRGRGEAYIPTEEYGSMCSVANDMYRAVRVVFGTRGNDGKATGYDLVLSEEGVAVKPSGASAFKPVTSRLSHAGTMTLVNGLLNNHVYAWGGSYARPGDRGRARWILDIYTADGGCISFKGNAYRPHNFDSVGLVVLSAAMMRRRCGPGEPLYPLASTRKGGECHGERPGTHHTLSLIHI